MNARNTENVKEGKTGFELVNPFMDRTKDLAGGALETIANQVHEELFGSPAPMGTHPILIRTKVCYKLQELGYEAAGKNFNNSTRKNYKAAMEYDINGFTSDLRDGLLRDMAPSSQPSADNPTGTQKTKKNPNSKFGQVGPLIYGILVKNNETKFTDEQIATQVNDILQDGKPKNAGHVAAYRSYLNAKRKEVPANIIAQISNAEDMFPINKWNANGEIVKPGRAKKAEPVVVPISTEPVSPTDAVPAVNE